MSATDPDYNATSMAKDCSFMKHAKRAESIAKVFKANDLIEARFEIDFSSYRLIHAIVTKLDSWPDAPPITSETPFTLHASEFARLFGLSSNRAYTSLREAVDRLAECWVVIERPSPESPTTPFTKTRWVTAVSYRENTGEVAFYFAPLIIPYLTQLALRFTRYELRHIAPLTSVYAIRLYELLVQYRDIGQREVRIDWIKECFQLSDKYTRITNLKARVIDPAVKQINTHSDLWVKYRQRKQGRAVEALIFSFGPKCAEQPLQTATRRAPRPITRAEIARQAHPGESWDQAEERLRRERDARAEPHLAPGDAASPGTSR
ncbi:MAG: RepB family plasmid replication initiator protein [Sphingobacteriia bacterium]|nr:RepB family plasmid replication initiator protein [Sphingobacteriia bacterium]